MSLPSFTAREATYYKLKISCPVCHDQGRNTPQSFWVHAKDGGPIFIGDDAHYQCESCQYHNHVMEWRYGCPQHSGDKLEYLKASSQGLAQAVSTAGQMVMATGNQWLIRFLENMGEF
jgi:hypothetical protein